jgi:hypothetical protein
MAMSVEQLCDVARVAIESDVNYCNRVLANKRAWIKLHFVTLFLFALYCVFYQHWPRWMLELMHAEIDMMLIEFGFALLVWLLTYLFPYKARDWCSWLPVLVLRWHDLKKPAPHHISGLVARILTQCGGDMNRDLPTMEQKMVFLAEFSAFLHRDAILLRTVGLA